jgi:peptidyl-prolyl cis-trans isomerase C
MTPAIATRARIGLALTVALALPHAARSQTLAESPGLAYPDVQSALGLTATLAELDRARGTIVAEIGSHTVTWGDVTDTIRTMPRVASGIPFNQLYQSAVGQQMQIKALAARAESLGLDKNPIVQRRMKNIADEVLADELVVRSLAPNLAEPALRAVYDGIFANKPGPDEVQIRVIVTVTQEQASDLIRRIQGGASFVAMAKEFSKDGTAGQGGDLGYARLDMLAPEVGAVAFSLGVGQMTAYPVKSGSLWFIIRAEGRRQVAAPTFEEARFELERDVKQAGIVALKQQALKEAPVVYYGLAGKKAPEQKSK